MRNMGSMIDNDEEYKDIEIEYENKSEDSDNEDLFQSIYGMANMIEDKGTLSSDFCRPLGPFE